MTIDIHPGVYNNNDDNKTYRVIGIGEHIKTGGHFVVYYAEASSNTQLLISPLCDFLARAENGKDLPRFEFIRT